MAESAKQEIEFPFNGKTYKVRPTFEIVINVETKLNQPSRVLGMKFYNGEASLMEIAATLAILIGDEAKKTAAEIGVIIMEEGYIDLIAPLGDLLTRAQRGNKHHAKESKPKGDENP